MSREYIIFRNSVIRVFLTIGIIVGLVLIMFTSSAGPWLQNPNLKGPYLSWVDDPTTTMTISWQTPIQTNGIVQWGNTTNYGNSIAGSSSVDNLYSVTITGLEPNTIYHYRIISNIRNYTQLVEDHWFKTAPNSTVSFSFIAYGDSRPDIFGNSGHRYVCNQMLKTEPNPAFILHTGDIVFQSNMENQWNQFFYELKDIIDHAPLFTALGNHEYNEFGGDYGWHYFNYFNYPAANNEWYYSFNYSNVHVISLNLSVSDVQISSAQINWLKNDLEKVNKSSNINWIVIFFHVPLYSSGGFGDDPLAISALEQIFIDYKVDLVISGHDHQYERMNVKGVQYIVTGGGGSELEVYIGGNEDVQYSENIHHFCLIEVNGLSMTIKTISSTGAIIDQFTLNSKHP